MLLVATNKDQEQKAQHFLNKKIFLNTNVILLCVCYACMSVCVWLVSMDVRRRQWILQDWLWAAMWVLWIKPMSFGGALWALNHRANAPGWADPSFYKHKMNADQEHTASAAVSCGGSRVRMPWFGSWFSHFGKLLTLAFQFSHFQNQNNITY